jgi:methionyl-tRNA formyltransferase
LEKKYNVKIWWSGEDMRIVFMGTPEFAVPSLEQLVFNHFQVVGVYTQPDRRGGRGQELIEPPVKKAALGLGLPVVQPAGMKAPEAVSQLAEFKPDVVVVAAYGIILPPNILDVPAGGFINIHPSLLPKYRGASPVATAILSGDEITGVSVMLLDAGMDTGPVLTRAAVSISAQDNTGTLTDKLSIISARLLQETLVRWLRHEITPRPQDTAAATRSSMLKKEDAELDWSAQTVDIWRRIRAYNPWPGSFTRWRGKQLKILEAVPLPAEGPGGVGKVVALAREGTKLGITTGDGVLGVKLMQLEGKRAMTSEEFARGQRDIVGDKLPD